MIINKSKLELLKDQYEFELIFESDPYAYIRINLNLMG